MLFYFMQIAVICLPPALPAQGGFKSMDTVEEHFSIARLVAKS
jgi:hypothetical protein